MSDEKIILPRGRSSSSPPPTQPMLYPGVMTLRQHFAGMALTGLAFVARCWSDEGGLKEDTVKSMAIAARQLADALIKELAETEAHDGKA